MVILVEGLGLVFKRNSAEFSIDFQELEFLEIMRLIGWVGVLIFQMDCDIMMPCRFLAGFRKTMTH